MKIGFVDTERILREAAPAERAQKKLEHEFRRARPGAPKRREADQDAPGELEKTPSP